MPATSLWPRHTRLKPEVMFYSEILYDSRSTLMVIPNTVTANVYASMVIQPVALPFIFRTQGEFSKSIMLALVLSL